VRYRLRECGDVLAGLDGVLTGDYASQLGETLVTGQRASEFLRVDRTFCHDVAVAVVLHLLQAVRPGTLLVEYIWMTRVLPLVGPDVVTVLDTHDVMSSRREKVVAFGIDDWDVPPEEEARRVARAQLVVAIQEMEATLLRALAPDRRVVTAGIDFSVNPLPLAAAPVVLCVASDNPMNTTGMADFLRFAWPRIRAACPDARLRVVGSIGRTMPAGLDGVELAGYVRDLDAEYTAARVVVNPATAGTGLKIKTLEALGHLRPVVAWPNGVDGLPEPVRTLIAPATDWHEFADRVVAWLRQDGPAFDGAGIDAVAGFLAADSVYGPLEAALVDLGRPPKAPGR
jgi:hypothetical protein